MKKILLLVMLALFSFSATVSANPLNPTPRTDTFNVGAIAQGGNHILYLDVWAFYNTSMVVQVLKEGPAGQWTSVYYYPKNLDASTYTSYTLNVGHLTPGNYKITVDFSNLAYVENYGFTRS
ncbi:hypothetical protein ACFQZE_14935 [Paenibacillus sp. GCM10027627]|uniref:hypothetical protein n=1 Tax=unclassified Paenibacillus TaxID=185978 RepID=UPI00362B956F